MALVITETKFREQCLPFLLLGREGRDDAADEVLRVVLEDAAGLSARQSHYLSAGRVQRCCGAPKKRVDSRIDRRHERVGEQSMWTEGPKRSEREREREKGREANPQ